MILGRLGLGSEDDFASPQKVRYLNLYLFKKGLST